MRPYHSKFRMNPFYLLFVQISGHHLSSRVTNRGKSRGREFWICASAAPCRLTAVGICHIHSCGHSAAGQRTKSPCVPWDVGRVRLLSCFLCDTCFFVFFFSACHARPLSDFLRQKTVFVETQKSAGRCSVYLIQGIAKRPLGNKQSTPTP